MTTTLEQRWMEARTRRYEMLAKKSTEELRADAARVSRVIDVRKASKRDIIGVILGSELQDVPPKNEEQLDRRLRQVFGS